MMIETNSGFDFMQGFEQQMQRQIAAAAAAGPQSQQDLVAFLLDNDDELDLITGVSSPSASSISTCDGSDGDVIMHQAPAVGAQGQQRTTAQHSAVTTPLLNLLGSASGFSPSSPIQPNVTDFLPAGQTDLFQLDSFLKTLAPPASALPDGLGLTIYEQSQQQQASQVQQMQAHFQQLVQQAQPQAQQTMGDTQQIATETQQTTSSKQTGAKRKRQTASSPTPSQSSVVSSSSVESASSSPVHSPQQSVNSQSSLAMKNPSTGMKVADKKVPLKQEEQDELDAIDANDSLDDKEKKRQRRLLKNRESAQASRERKKVYVSTLEQKVNELTQQNEDLTQKVDNLERENAMLRDRLMRLERGEQLSPIGAAHTTDGDRVVKRARHEVAAPAPAPSAPAVPSAAAPTQQSSFNPFDPAFWTLMMSFLQSQQNQQQQRPAQQAPAQQVQSQQQQQQVAALPPTKMFIFIMLFCVALMVIYPRSTAPGQSGASEELGTPSVTTTPVSRPAARNILGKLENGGAKEPVAIKISFKKPTSTSRDKCDVDEQVVKNNMLRVFEDNLMQLGEHAMSNVTASAGRKVSISASANSESADQASTQEEDDEEDEDEEIFQFAFDHEKSELSISLGREPVAAETSTQLEATPAAGKRKGKASTGRGRKRKAASLQGQHFPILQANGKSWRWSKTLFRSVCQMLQEGQQ